MNNITTLQNLAAVPAGDYDVNERVPWWKFWQPRKRGGWLLVEKEPDASTSIMWTTHQKYHQPLDGWGPARAISISPSGKLIAYFESALSMWMIWGYGRGGDEELQRALAFAEWSHRKLCRKDDAQPT